VDRLRRSSLFLNLFSVAGAAVLNRLIGLVTLGYAARVLGPENYGLVGYGLSVAAYAGILVSPGLLTWGTREVARDRAQAGKMVLLVTLTRLVLAFVAYAALVVLAFGFLAERSQRAIVLVCGLILFHTALSADWVLNGLELMRVPALLSVINAVVYAVALLTLVRSPENVYIYALIRVPIGLILSGIVYGLLFKRVRVQLAWPGFREARQALLASLPLGLTMALVVILHYANNLIVQAYLGMAVLGIFLAAYSLLELATQLPGILATVFLPRLARCAAEATLQARQEALLFARVHMVAAFFVAAFFLAEAPALIGIVYGVKYAAAVPYLRLMAFAIVFNYAICGYTNCLISFSKDRVMLGVVTACTIVSVGGGFLLVPRMGALGAALVITCIDLAGWLVSLPHYRRAIGSLQFRAWLLPALGGAAIVCASLLFRHIGWPAWARLPLSALAYAPFVLQDIRGALK